MRIAAALGSTHCIALKLKHSLELNDGPSGPSYVERAAFYGCGVLVRFSLFGLQHLHATPLCGASHFVKDIHCGEAQTLVLVGIESLVERLPCLGELLEACASFAQGMGAHAHEIDWIK